MAEHLIARARSEDEAIHRDRVSASLSDKAMDETDSPGDIAESCRPI